MTSNPVPLRQVIAFHLRRHREDPALALTQDHVARAAQRLGFDWGRSSVAAIEAGERDLSAAELLAFPYILDEAVRVSMPGAEVAYISSLAELVMPGNKESLEVVPGVGLSGQQVEGWLGAEPPGMAPRKLDRPLVGEAEHKAARSLGVDLDVVLETSIDLWGCTLTEKRDELLRDEHPSPQRRGHVTRRLLAEMRNTLAKKGAK